MFKKTTAIFLSLLMLLTLSTSASVFAAMPQSGSETNGAKWTDNFNGYTASTTLGFNGYPVASANHSSDVFVAFSGFSGSFVEDGGRDGSVAMKINQRNDGNNVMLRTKDVDFDTYDAFVFAQEFKILRNPATTTTFYLGASSGWGGRQFLLTTDSSGAFVLKNYQDNQTLAYELNHWYKLMVMQQADGTRRGWLLDAATGDVLMTNTMTVTASSNNNAAILFGADTTATADTVMQIMVDNAELYAYKMSAYAPDVTSSTLANGETGVGVNDSATVTFDQPLKTAAATVYPMGNSSAAASCTVTAVSGKLNTYTVAWSGLDGGARYTLDLSGFTNDGNAACGATIGFVTAESGIEVVTDGFENAGLFQSAGYDTGQTGWFGIGANVTEADNVTQNATGGYGGGAAMDLKKVGTGTYMVQSFNKLPLAADEVLVETYRMNIADYDSKFSLSLGVYSDYFSFSRTIAGISVNSNTGKLTILGAGYSYASGAELTANHWYNLTMAITQNQHTLYVTDSETGQQVWKHTLYTDGKTTNSGGNVSTIGPYNEGVGIVIAAVDSAVAIKSQSVLIDDLSLWRMKPTAAAHKLAMTEASATEIEAEDSLTLTFNQPVTATANDFKLYLGNDTNDEAEATVSVASSDFNKLTLSFSGLARGTDYTLDYSALTAVSGADFGSNTANALLHFKTIAGEEPISVVTDGFDTPSMFNRSGYDTNTTHNGWFGADQWCTAEGNITQNATGGYGGGAAMQLKKLSNGGYSIKSHEALSLASDEVLIETYRMNITDKGTVTQTTNDEGETTYSGDFELSLAAMAGGSSYIVSSKTIAGISINPNTGNLTILGSGYSYASGAELAENHWYNLTLVIKQTGQTIYVTDTQSGALIWQHTLYTDGITENGGNNTKTIDPYTDGVKIFVAVATATVASTQTVLLDDVSLWRIKPAVNKQKLSLPTVSGQTIEPNGSISLTFNQPVVARDGDMTLYRGDAKNAYSSVSVANSDFNKLTLSFSNLYHANDYTLDYSTLTAVSGADFGANKSNAKLAFSTTASSNALEVVSEVSCSGLKANDGLTFDVYSKTAGSYTFFAGLYGTGVNERLLGVEKATKTLTAGRQTVTLPFTSAHSEAGKAKIFALNGNSLAPLMKSVKLTVPTESLKVLMIGNSLSEDANRYLNAMATAGGVELDLTLKGIGGATLANHAANLKAELNGRTAAEAQTMMDNGEADRLLYFTYENGQYVASTDENKLLLNALNGDKKYDVITLQQFADYGADTVEDVKTLCTEIRKLQPEAEIMLYQTWSNYSSIQVGRDSYFTQTIEPTVASYAAAAPKAVAGLTKGNAAMTIIPSGRAFYMADHAYDWCGTAYTGDNGNTDPDAQQGSTLEAALSGATGLWRDYNHASYYGCYLTDAVWYETLTGQIAPTGTAANPIVAAPNGVSAADHLARLEQLRDVAHQVVLEQSK